MNSARTSRGKHLDFILLDLICIELSFLIAYAIRLGRTGENAPGDYYLMNIVILFVHLAVAFSTECYSGIMRRGYWKEFKKVVIHNAIVLGVILAALFFYKNSSDYSRVLMALFVVIDTCMMCLVRMLRKKYLYTTQSEKGKGCMLIVSDSKHVEATVKGFQDMRYKPFVMKGVIVVDEDMTGKEICGLSVVGNADNMHEYVKSNVIDEVFIEYLDSDLGDMVKKFVAMGVTVHVSINELMPQMPNSTVVNMNNHTVITAGIYQMSIKQKIIKRLIDICAGLVGLVFIVILFVIFAPIIYIQSPGPVFFKQVRVGKNGRQFKLYKFRSMYMDAEERKNELMEKNKMSGLMFKMDDDPRVTPIGKFIRKTSIDEFPQFINILKGDMSLVGTRPPTVDEYEQYEQHHKSRLAMKPGLTGLWQVSGRSEITDFEEVVKLDNEYIANFSIGNDIKIILKTVGVVLRRKGSV